MTALATPTTKKVTTLRGTCAIAPPAAVLLENEYGGRQEELDADQCRREGEQPRSGGSLAQIGKAVGDRPKADD